ncbi:Mannose-specific lectin 1 [Dendrobium catenatum]|uniref:Mannose-specific lectin 1 n=1 Tax=Dendrobium catenatum TaxID=906689 RepID=A0A2I0VLD6_9ASPA|nr:Mannose-specific lectin 1 [Dendrobium catenatum]
MQKDCNLVLYDNQTALWSSHTDNKGVNCFLVLQNNGELVIISNYRITVWRSETGGQAGKYALVLQPNGDVVVYGNPVWSTGTSSATFLVSIAVLVILATSTDHSAKFYGNVLKSGGKLDTGESLVHGNYSFVMQKDCNLVLYDNQTALWSSHTDNKGVNCFLVLQNNGELVIISNYRITVWRSETGGQAGKYALVLQPNGDVVVYGNPVWSTGTSNIEIPKH